MNTKPLLLLAICLIGVGVAYADTDAELLELSLTVPSVCDISLSKSSLTFGVITINVPSTENSTVITNLGTVPANLTIKGTNWSDGGSNSILVGYTKFATTSGNYDTKTALTTTEQTLYENLDVEEYITTYLQVKVPQGTKSGTYTQNITITGVC